MPNSTVETVGWRSEPANRGTFGLLFSCISTLVICVYTAVHLNIPKKGTIKLRLYGTKTGWVILGILAPECVLYTAWSQWYSAKKLTARVKSILDDKPHIHSEQKPPWTMTHSFFAGMGGFVFDTEDADCPPYILGSPRLILTAHGIAKLAEHGHLPNVPEEQIADKSKADFVAKLLAILQASWLLVQCVARWKAHLTMTLLELITLAHAICALLMYLLWMNKPYDVHEPIRLSGEWVRPLCATMSMFSHISTEKPREGRSERRSRPEIEGLLFADVSRLRSPHHVRMQNFEPETGFGPRQESEHSPVRTIKLPIQSEIREITLTRWRLASAFLRENQDFWVQYAKKYTRIPEIEAGCPIYEFPAMNLKAKFVDTLVSNWPGDDLLGREDRVVLRSFLLTFATAAYGGIHALAWNEYFATASERHWWRFASVFIAASGVLMCLWTVGGLMRSRTPVSHEEDHMPKTEEGFWAWLGIRLVMILVCTACVAAVIYVVARSYLVVEALISLRQLPITAYQTPRFVQVIPHL